MRNNGQKQRMRGRNRRGHNPMTRVYESNGPDVKVRGTAHHIADKYMQLARDAQTSGDPVAAEGYLQHAEHYFRLIVAAQAAFALQNPHNTQPQPAPPRPDQLGEEYDDDEGDDGSPDMPHHPGSPGAPQPHFQQPHQQQPQPQQYRQPQQHQPQPQQQPQPNFQPQPQQQRRPDEPRDPGLPSFITGGGQAPNQPPNQAPGNGFNPEQGERDGGRFGRRHRRRFRPHGSGEFEPRGDRPNEAPAQGSPAQAAPAQTAPAGEQPSGEFNPPKPQGPTE